MSTSASITASINFDFKGQHFTPSVRVDLHSFMVKKQHTVDLYNLLGASIGLDAYRHEYDIMVLEPIIFSEPSGLACAFLSDGILDFDGFAQAWQQQQISATIQPIAQRFLGISDLNEHDKIKQALLASYRAGQQNPESSPPKPQAVF